MFRAQIKKIIFCKYCNSCEWLTLDILCCVAYCSAWSRHNVEQIFAVSNSCKAILVKQCILGVTFVAVLRKQKHIYKGSGGFLIQKCLPLLWKGQHERCISVKLIHWTNPNYELFPSETGAQFGLRARNTAAADD